MDGSSRVHTAQCKGRGESVSGHLYSGPLPQERAEKEPLQIHRAQNFFSDHDEIDHL